MATLRKRKLKNGWIYIIDFIYKGKRHTISTKTQDKKLAQEIFQEIQGKIARGTFLEPKEQRKDIYFKDFIEEYFKYVEGHKKQSTIQLERTYLPRVLKIIGNKLLRSIDQHSIDKWQAQFARAISPTTFNIVLRILHAAFNIAKRWRYIDENPFSHVEKLKVEEKRLFLRNSEVEKIFELIDADILRAMGPGQRENVIRFRKTFKLFVEFLLNTGLRREEALKLRMEHVDLSQNVISVEKTKTSQLRMIPLNRRAREILVELGQNIFSKLNKHDVTNKFRHYLGKADLVGFKLHSLRHTFATRLLSMGVDLYTISRLLGHTDIKTTMIYAKTNVETLRGVVEKLDGSCDTIATRRLLNDNGQ